MVDFVEWFHAHGALLDTDVMGITEFPISEGGRGAIALKDIPEGYTLFTIPRDLTLSTRTSGLPVAFGYNAWKKANLHNRWVGLILCMMWEKAKGQSSKWAGYLDILPKRFDTPMFWSEDDLLELKGTSVVEKLGKKDAEVDYSEKLLPAVRSRPDLFPPEDILTYYSLAIYHVMGSCILSRSFIVEKWDEGEGEDATDPNASPEDAMDVDGQDQRQETDDQVQEEAEEGDDEDEEEAFSDVAMVPMADMLNARYQTENAKLFYEEDALRMVSTRPIKSGEQIWNTYGDLPNNELLRRYGHVDILSPPSGSSNPGDIVEIKANSIEFIVVSYPEAAKGEKVKERIDWWLEEGGEDTFVLDHAYELPLVMISFTKLLLLPEDEWEKAREKHKPPKSKLEGILYTILISALENRLAEYPTTLETDKKMSCNSLPLNKQNALIVRIGEKEILHGTLKRLKNLRDADKARPVEASNKRKQAISGSSGASKKSRR